MRLFFPLPAEEELAVALTGFLGHRAGSRLAELTPDMTMGEVLDLARDRLWTGPEFAQMLELAGLAAFDEELEQMTFRDFVRYGAHRRSKSTQRGWMMKGEPRNIQGGEAAIGERHAINAINEMAVQAKVPREDLLKCSILF
jgi:hypothetical protein